MKIVVRIINSIVVICCALLLLMLLWALALVIFNGYGAGDAMTYVVETVNDFCNSFF